MKSTILIIEDDQAVNELLIKNLVNLGYSVESAFDGETGLNLALNNDYEIILLDVMIPKLDGFQVLQALRVKKSTPVLMLTAKGGEQDRIFGFKTGADDYLSKPFNMAELELRIQAILRRTQGLPKAEVSSTSIQFYKKEGLVHIKDETIPFTPLEFDLLFTLVQEQGEVLSKA